MQQDGLSFKELSEQAKETAIEQHRDWNTSDHDWWDCVYEDAMRVGACLGIEIDKINFSGFWSQGDGCWIKATYKVKSDAPKAVRAHAPKDEELHKLADDLAVFATTAKLAYSIDFGARMDIHNHGYQSVDVIAGDDDNPFYSDYLQEEQELTILLKRFTRWIYEQLEAEHEYLTSDEAISELLTDSGLRFDEDGHTL